MSHHAGSEAGPVAPYPSGEPATPPPPYDGASSTPARPQGTNGLSIAGLILAIIIAPIGFIVSVIGLILASKRRQKGKGLAIAGIVISLIVMTGVGLLVAKIAGNATTIADPGCTAGKAAILDNADKVGSNDATTEEAGFNATIDGLKAAAAKAKHANVRTTVTTVAEDYSTILAALKSGSSTDGLQEKLTKDAGALDDLCTLGGS